MATKTKPTMHVRVGDEIVFTSQVSGAQKTDKIVKVSLDDMTNEVTMSFPPEYIVLQSGEKLEVQPSSTVVYPGHRQIEYVV